MMLHLNKYGTGFPLVFFHGWGFDSQVWLPLVPELMQHYQIISVDLPGFGQSSMMDWDLFKSQLLAKIPDHFAVLGWSMGGLYATRLAIEEPERVRYLINITSSPRFVVDEAWPGIPQDVIFDWHQKLLINPLGTLDEFINLQINKNKILGTTPSIAGLESGFKILGSWDFREELYCLKQPVCYIFGLFDSIIPIKTMKVMQERHPDFHYVFLTRAGHVPFLSHKDLFIEEIRRFIS